MALAMPSRFAVLKIEDDDFHPPNPNKSKEKKKVDPKQAPKKNDKAAGNSKKQAKAQTTQKVQNQQQKKEKKKKEAAVQWEQWKKKDNEFVDGNFEQDLHNAILQSKLEYEEKKQKKDNAQSKQPEPSDVKKKKSKVMSLEQFKNMLSEPPSDKNDSSKSCDEEADTQFFEIVKSEAKAELKKELSKEQNKEKKKVRQSFNNDTIKIAQLQEEIEALKAETVRSKVELDKYKEEILVVKKRNKTLCGMLATGEMKDKADVLMELQKLAKVREELTEEVARLHVLLEQERSKVRALQGDQPTNSKHKDKNKK